MIEYSKINCGSQPKARWEKDSTTLCILCPAHTDRFLSLGAPRKSRIEGPNFYRSESAHTDRLFIADKTSDLPYHFFYRSLIWRTRPDFLSELLCCGNCRRGPIIGLRQFDFLSDQKSVYDKNRSVCICSIKIIHIHITKLMLSKYAQNVYLMVLVQVIWVLRKPTRLFYYYT